MSKLRGKITVANALEAVNEPLAAQPQRKLRHSGRTIRL